MPPNDEQLQNPSHREGLRNVKKNYHIRKRRF